MRARLALDGVAVVLLGGLVLLAVQGLAFAVVAIGLAALICATIVLGPERLGTAFVMLAMFTAPQNSVRPIANADFVTFSDLFLLLGGVLLVPTIVRRRAAYPPVWVVGSILVSVMVLVASLLSKTPALDLVYGPRLPAAIVVIPLFFLAWRPGLKLVDTLAWCYVAGHVVSTFYAVVNGKDPATGRYDGLTTHYNFFGIGAVVSAGLLIHLHSRMPWRWKWVAWLAALVCAASVSMSGSRAAALVIIMIALLYPAMERSLMSAYLMVAGALVGVVLFNKALTKPGNGSAFTRLRGDSTTSVSDLERTNALHDGLHKFYAHPILGGGFDASAILAHNVYLEVAIGIGVVGLAAYLMVLVTAIMPLFSTGELRRLAYVPLGYAALAMLTNSLWDRFVWMGIGMSFLAAAPALVDRPPPRDRRRPPVHPIHPIAHPTTAEAT